MVGSRCTVSASRLRNWHALNNLGFSLDTPVGGMLELRGHSGCVIRWGEGWFEVVRDGVGWEFQRHDRVKISERVDILLRMFPWRRQSSLLAIVDSVLAIE